MESERYVTAKAVCAEVGIGPDKLRKLTLAGKVPAYQPGGEGRKMYLVSEVRAVIAASRYRAPDAAARAAAAVERLLASQRGR